MDGERIPRVSVLMCAYNAERYVGEAVASIFSQTFDDWEFVIVDDGSTDRTPDILKHFANRDVRIRLVLRPHAGISAARIESMVHAKGEFVAVQDADDISLPDRLARQVEYLQEHLSCVAVGCDLQLIDPDGDPICVWIADTSHAAFLDSLLRGEKGQGCALMMRRQAVLGAGGYRADLRAAEDHDLLLRLAEHGQLGNVPAALVKYRQHFTSACRTLWENLDEDLRAVVRTARQKRDVRASDAELQKDPGELSQLDLQRVWAWWALKAGNVETARKHALAVLARRPFAPQAWRLVACTLRGY